MPHRGLDALETPALFVDLDAVDRNIARAQAYCTKHGLAFRPHIKTHKLPAIAHRQIAAGAVGIACQTVGKAETMADAGIDDIMLTFPLVRSARADRLARLARTVHISAVGDSGQVVSTLSAAAAAHGVTIDFLVECDTGYQRTGVQSPDDALALGQLAHNLPGLRAVGLMTYPTPRDDGFLTRARDLFNAADLPVTTISAGGTDGLYLCHRHPVLTEIRSGTYVYGDRACIANGSVSLDDCALRVAATVVSRPTPDRAILDAGSKALTSDPAEGTDHDSYGLIFEYPSARLHTLSEEHGHVDLSGCHARPALGEVVTIIPNHACGVTNLFATAQIVRDAALVDTWSISARRR